MAAKKIAKKTTESATSSAPAAKKTAKKAAKKATKSATAAPAAELAPVAKAVPLKMSADAIARAAYLNYRRRVELGLPGDSRGDWLEAERQLASGMV